MNKTLFLLSTLVIGGSAFAEGEGCCAKEGCCTKIIYPTACCAPTQIQYEQHSIPLTTCSSCSSCCN
ncbi:MULTISPECIES: hypothetical protein [Holospora]|uniref:Uncharacterized protein n=2 Tax=Holospora TaxID=44747 RepID=A0A061JI38_9PROT|nr:MULTISPECIES: hypothetical protein [Holospora]ETZ04654.1 hypothetical protein K737_300929 [Holospora undulata HU1]GAJ46066.1 hypothetical protein HE1_00387 [Holospora elegans E1]